MTKVKNDWAWRAAEKLCMVHDISSDGRACPQCVNLARSLRRAHKRGYDQGVIAMATKINQATGK